MSKKGGSMKYFSEDSAGFKIQPKTVLRCSTTTGLQRLHCRPHSMDCTAIYG